MDPYGLGLLGWRTLRAGASILADRGKEVVGAGLPRTPEQLATPDKLNRLLRDAAPVGQAAPPRVARAQLPGVDFESSNCINFLVDVEFDATNDARDLPRSLYAKLPCEELGTRVFANAVGFWEVEASFCQRVATQVPIRVPRVYAAAREGARFVLLLENLSETPGTRMFINRDMAAGTTIERARMCIETFAELHAAFWGWGKEQRDALVPARMHTYLAPGGRNVTRALNEAAVSPAQKAAPDVFTAAHADLFRRATANWDAVIDAWYGGPLTLIHGDSHLANCFEYATDAGPRMGMIDFQGMHWSKGVRDLQYFLINSLEPELLAQHEQELIATYVDALAKQGVSLDLDEAREQYRAFSFQTLMVAVTSLGLGSLTERDDTVRTVLRRSTAAIDRLDFDGWLRAL